MRTNKSVWAMIALFFLGGVAFWIFWPETPMGPIWVGVSVFVTIILVIKMLQAARAAEALSKSGFTQAGVSSGFGDADLTSMTISSQSMSATAGSDAGQAVLDTLKQYGIDPAGGTVDLRNLPAARAAVLEALKTHGVDIAHAVAAASPVIPIQPTGQPLDRMAQLKQLHDAKLISEEEFEASRKRILEGL